MEKLCGDEKTNCWILIYNKHEMRLFMWISCIIWMYDNNACRFYCIFFSVFCSFLYLLNISIAHITSRTFFSYIFSVNDGMVQRHSSIHSLSHVLKRQQKKIFKFKFLKSRQEKMIEVLEIKKLFFISTSFLYGKSLKDIL